MVAELVTSSSKWIRTVSEIASVGLREAGVRCVTGMELETSVSTWCMHM